MKAEQTYQPRCCLCKGSTKLFAISRGCKRDGITSVCLLGFCKWRINFCENLALAFRKKRTHKSVPKEITNISKIRQEKRIHAIPRVLPRQCKPHVTKRKTMKTTVANTNSVMYDKNGMRSDKAGFSVSPVSLDNGFFPNVILPSLLLEVNKWIANNPHCSPLRHAFVSWKKTFPYPDLLQNTPPS